ncbi:sulfatase [Daejeonella sp.]|uniref:sulfatase family protein n=1 Tax=Daejeonella sp. TaxID=2805397 RepID=UPI0030C440EB
MKHYKLFAIVLTLIALYGSVNAQPPNIIVILADDLGYGDLGCYGHPTIKTPNLDRMAAEGIRFTQFYVGASICTPSRAAFLTGRLAIRSGMAGSDSSGNALYPKSTGGLPASEITVAEALKTKNYTTALVGKWHLGHLPQFLPINHGFDLFYGLPYSNDMVAPAYKNAPPLPFMENGKIIESNPDQRLLTKRYTAKAIDFIKANKSKPFFLYYANNFPHVPLHASETFLNKSDRGLFGDAVEELDWSVGEILKNLKLLGLDKNTLVIFTSDNGPWLRERENGGSAGMLFEGKGSTYEGGFRVPAIARWSGKIKPNQTSSAIATTMDLYPTFLKLAGVAFPGDRVIDGKDLYPLLMGQTGTQDEVYYYNRDKLYAIRKGSYKAHFITKASYSKELPEIHNIPLLFDIEHDPSEKFEIGKAHPEVISRMIKIKDKHKAGIVPAFSQLDLGYREK